MGSWVESVALLARVRHDSFCIEGDVDITLGDDVGVAREEVECSDLTHDGHGSGDFQDPVLNIPDKVWATERRGALDGQWDGHGGEGLCGNASGRDRCETDL